jgi:gluconokinase
VGKLVVVFGLSGSGKSFISKILHEDFGYEWIRSDAIRREIMGIDPDKSVKQGFGQGIYSEKITHRVYEEMLRRAKNLLRKGSNVVLDATFLRAWQREQVLKVFPKALFILVEAPEGEIKRRLESRQDISDADFEIYLKQKEVFEPPKEVNFIKIKNTKSRRELSELLAKVLGKT